MNINEKIELIKRNTIEVISEDELRQLFENKKKPVVYCGYEPSGFMHLGHFNTIIKLKDFAKAGFKVKILLADVHALLNRKGTEKEIAEFSNAWKKTIKAIGLDAEVVLGSSFQFKKDYAMEVMRLAQVTTIKRGLHSMQEIGRDMENAMVSQMWYPLMQVVDIKHLGCDVAYGALEQRKIHVLARDHADVIKHKPILVHTPMITSLKGPGAKMSKSIPGTGISVNDSDKEIKSAVNKAYCPEKIIEDNPILQVARLVIFPNLDSLEITRPEKFGGNVSFRNYEEMEKAYTQGKIHPADLKNTVASELIKIIQPIRDNFKK